VLQKLTGNMALKYYLGIIVMLIACSIILAVVVRSLAEGIAVSGKKPYVFGSGAAILTSLAAYSASFLAENLFEMFWLIGGIFFILGIMHMLFIHPRFFYAHRDNWIRVLIGEVIYGLALILFTIVVFSALQYFFKDRDFLYYPTVMSTLLFFVPLLIYHSFETAYEIPAANFPTWQYPQNRSLEPLDIYGNDRELIIGFEVSEKPSESRKNYFRVRAPETCQLSTLFYHFLNEYNDPENRTKIEYLDNENEPYKWWFYKRRKWYQARKILNPEFSIRESGIAENTVIICERVLNTVTVKDTYNKKYYER
jgi:hypothetical protein